MAQDMEARPYGTGSPGRIGGLRGAVEKMLTPAATAERRGLGLSSKLLLLTALFVMLAEILIFVPSIANFRVTWLNDRLTAARLASLAGEAVPGGAVPEMLRQELLKTAQVKTVAIKHNDQRRVILPPTEGELDIAQSYDLRLMDRSGGLLAEFGFRLGLIGDALAVFFQSDRRLIRVVGQPSGSSPDFVEIVVPQGPLRTAMVRYGLNVLGLSIIISIFSAALVYLALRRLLVEPMMRITRNMLHFSQKPEDASRIIAPSDRTDEVGTAERELAHMQSELASLLQQKSRLAALGLAVSKINHDLRNLLANTQLISDRLTTIKDPTVQRFAPKLIASLDRAISFCNDTLKFGRAAEAAPRRERFLLRPLVDEVGEGLGLPRGAQIGWAVEMPADIEADADRDHLYRILTNLIRNSVQALEAQGKAAALVKVTARRGGPAVAIDVSDTGPGVPEVARAHLFEAFQGSTRKGGSGLGLAIAHELAVAHGGDLTLLDTPKGATFRIELPDRPNKK